MKNLTKLLALLLAVVFCLCALTACRSDEKKDTADASQAPVASVSDSAEPETEPEQENAPGTESETESEPETTSEPETQSETQDELTTEAAPEGTVGYEEAETEEE